MPVTKTAKRALRSSKRKQELNTKLASKLEISTRMAKRLKSEKAITAAISIADTAAKKKLIHKNKAARIKSALGKLLPTIKKTSPKAASKASAKKPVKK